MFRYDGENENYAMDDHMLRLALPLVAMVLAAPAVAGGYVAPATPAPAPYSPPPVAGTDWTGFYAGGQVDFLRGTLSQGALNAELDGHLIGGFVGYRYDFGTIVLGGEVDYMTGNGAQSFVGSSLDVDYDSLLRVGVELGYDTGAMLGYVSVGYVDLDVSPSAGGPSSSGDGVFVGVGIDYMISDSVTIGGETNFHRFEDFGGVTGLDLEALTIGLNLAFRF